MRQEARLPTRDPRRRPAPDEARSCGSTRSRAIRADQSDSSSKTPSSCRHLPLQRRRETEHKAGARDTVALDKGHSISARIRHGIPAQSARSLRQSTPFAAVLGGANPPVGVTALRVGAACARPRLAHSDASALGIPCRIRARVPPTCSAWAARSSRAWTAAGWTGPCARGSSRGRAPTTGPRTRRAGRPWETSRTPTARPRAMHARFRQPARSKPPSVSPAQGASSWPSTRPAPSIR